VVLLALAAGLALGCGRTGGMVTIEEAKARHEARLLAVPGVVSVGIGRDASDRRVLVVGIRDRSPAALERIPAELDGHPVVVRAMGSIRAR
jgi:hypothetical protein